MRKKTWTISSLLLLVVIIIGVYKFMDKPNVNENSSSSSTSIDLPKDPFNTITPTLNDPIPGTVHEINVSSTEIDFFKNGLTNYKIVIPTLPNSYEDLGASELQLFMEQATSYTMDIISDVDLVLDASSQYISIGRTSLALAAEIEADGKELTDSGYRIVTKNQSVFILGGGKQGSLYGTYEFLKHTINFQVYASDEIVYNKNVKDLKLVSFDITDIPDIAWRTKNYGVFDANIMFAQRSRLSLQDDIWITVGGNSWHNSFSYIDPAIYGNEHPEWFSEDKTQLCYTNDEMREELTKKLIEVVDANPNLSNITITQQDYNTWSARPKDLELKNKYGTDSASMIIFANKVSQSLKEHFAQISSDRVVEVCFFAYQRTETPPTKYDPLTDTFSPIDDLVKCDENVNVFYAPIYADYNVSVLDPLNRSLYDVMRAWTSVTDKFYLWTYSTNFVNYLAFYNSFDSMQSVYKLAKQSNAHYIYDQGQWNQPNSTGFGALKNFLNPQLQWNVNLNMEELTQEWFDNYFKDASDTMKELFDNIRTHYAYLKNETSMSHSLFVEMAKSEYFSKGVLDGWVDLIDQAHKDIEPLQELDSALFQRLQRRIEQEFIFIGYVLVEAYSAAYSPSDLLVIKKRVREATSNAGMTMLAEVTSISDLWTKWGI